MTRPYTPAQLEAWAGLGPWEWCENWLYVANYNEHPGPVLWYTANDDGVHAKPDDAALIAAAPDLARLVLEKEKELARLRKALAFYADPLSWKARGNPQMDYDTKPILRDGGAIARQAMKETSDE